MKLILIGDRRSKGVAYFQQAAGQLGLPLRFLQLPYGAEAGAFPYHELEGTAVKLDPPRYETVDLREVNRLIEGYGEFLRRLSRVPGIRLLNAPEAVLNTLDKRRCKAILSGTGAAVTPVVADGVRDFNELRVWMLDNRTYRVFIKPVCGSGAGGVAAYHINPVNRREVLYTSALPEGAGLINTKKLRKFEERGDVALIAAWILRDGAVVEKWLPKAGYRGKSYDLRAVWQFGRIHYLVARQSSGPITNLHLNNDALDVSTLGLAPEKLAEIEALCGTAAHAFTGLNVVGIDVLLTPGTLTPYIIEMNAQGDLIYQDIGHENRIYRAQLEYMKELTGGRL